jgi:hypothetical protein
MTDFTTIRVTRDVKVDLLKIKNDLLSEVGHNFTMDQVLEILVKEYLNNK